MVSVDAVAVSTTAIRSLSRVHVVETIRSGYESFSRGDMPTVPELLADDIEWNEPEWTYGTPTGTFRGKQEVLSIFEQIPEHNDSFSLEPA